jgi:hypothetical protein
MAKTPQRVLRDAILIGDCDEDLDVIPRMIYNATKNRKRELSRDLAQDLSIGDAVVIRGDVRPRYAIGLSGKVVRVDDDMVLVELDEPIRRMRRAIARFNVPAYNLDLILNMEA